MKHSAIFICIQLASCAGDAATRDGGVTPSERADRKEPYIDSSAKAGRSGSPGTPAKPGVLSNVEEERAPNPPSCSEIGILGWLRNISRGLANSHVYSQKEVEEHMSSFDSGEIGLCLGGRFSYRETANNKDVVCVVSDLDFSQQGLCEGGFFFFLQDFASMDERGRIVLEKGADVNVLKMGAGGQHQATFEPRSNILRRIVYTSN